MDPWIYYEKIKSRRTGLLFATLAMVFLGLGLWRIKARRMDAYAKTFWAFCGVFLFYTINYQTLTIEISKEALRLKFGLFTWTAPLANIESACLDELPALMRYGGAGVHFMTVQKRYRASFNFLEYPRVVVRLKQPVGPVRDISFTTRQPELVLRALHAEK